MLSAVAFLALFSFCLAGTDNDEFFEVNVRKVLKNSNVQFGAQIYTDHLERYPDLIKKIGPVFQLAHWMTVWEVSGVAPAPHEADDELMERWIGSIYWNMPTETGPMENTSKMLENEGIRTVASASTAPNSYYLKPKDLARFRERAKAFKEGRKLEEEEWSVEKAMEEKEKEKPEDNYNLLIPESVPDFAKFWALSVDHLQKMNMSLPLIELTWEPDSKERMFAYPEDYAAVVRQTREQLRLREIPDDMNKIVGPGTSRPSAAKEYIEALVKDKDAYDALYAWSVHIHDDGSSMEEIEREILGFKKIVKATVPSSWAKKPVIVTSFGYTPASNLIYDDVEYNGDLDRCYRRIFGTILKADDDLANTIAQSPTTGVRLLASLLVQFSLGFTQSIYEELADMPWSHRCAGMFDRKDRQKQIFVAFSTFLPYLTKESIVVKKQWKNTGDCVTAVLKSSDRLVVAVANPSPTSCSRSFSLSGLDTKKINDPFIVSYNNGTVSLLATDPSEALVLKQPLDYDVYPPEEGEVGDVMEFDVVIGPMASATAIINLTKEEEPLEKVEVLVNEAYQPETVRTEL